jgi:prephenate dehydrogenase
MFKRAAIVGVGLIGGSLGMALRQRGLAREVIGFARRKETLDAAESLGAIDRRAASAPEAVAGADLIVLAAPIQAIIARLREIAPHISRGALVTDVGSTKQRIAAAAARYLPNAVNFVGGHPMAGSEQAGVSSATPGLFEGATWLVAPSHNTRPSALRKLQRLVVALGAGPLIVSPAEHDRLVAAVSHLPHMAAVALVEIAAQLAKRDDRVWQVAATGFRDATRLASGDPAVWRDICLTNGNALRTCIRAIIARLASWEKALARADANQIETLLSRAKKVRDCIS